MTELGRGEPTSRLRSRWTRTVAPVIRAAAAAQPSRGLRAAPSRSSAHLPLTPIRQPTVVAVPKAPPAVASRSLRRLARATNNQLPCATRMTLNCTTSWAGTSNSNRLDAPGPRLTSVFTETTVASPAADPTAPIPSTDSTREETMQLMRRTLASVPRRRVLRTTRCLTRVRRPGASTRSATPQAAGKVARGRVKAVIAACPSEARAPASLK